MKAKTKLTKLWSILIALVMLVGLLPTTALAAEATVTADFTSGDGSAALELLNAAKTEGVADSEWDSTTNTLTLNGVNFETTAATAVKLPAVEGGVTIVLNGVNTITGGDSESAHCYGIYAAGSLTIEGDGTLNVTCGDTTCDDNESIGICAYKGSVVIKGGTVDATGGVADGGSFGIFAYKGSMVIEGGNVKATGGTAMENGSTRGIYAYRGSVSISGGNVDATGGVADGYSFGICANEGSVVIEGGTVKATGSDASYGSIGIFAEEGSVNISGGTVDATSGDASYGSYGIFAEEGSVNISGGTVDATSGAADESSIGIYTVYGSVAISGGTVDATSGYVSSGSSLGIYSKNNINISGTADVTAKGGKTPNAVSFGISAEKQVNISGGTVKAIGGEGLSSEGIYSGNGDIRISGGKVTARGGTVSAWSVGIYANTSNSNLQISDTADVTAIGGDSTNDSSFGIYSANNVTISGGTLTAISGSASVRSYGINSTNNVTFAGGTLTAATKGDDCINATLDVTGSGVKTISFDRNGGSGNMKAYTNADSYTLPANSFVAPSYKKFKCWSVADTEKAAGNDIDVDADTTVKAVWDDITYTVTVTNGTASTSKAAAGTTVTLTADAAPSGQVFDKWVVESESASITFADANSATTTFTMPDGNVIVKATYASAYTITFDANGGSVTPASAVTDTDGKLTSLPTPTRSRYSFNGWYTKASGGTKVDTDYVFNANTTIYAHWTSTGDGGGGGTVTTNTVTADSVKNGDVAISPKYAAKGTIVTLKIEPDKGYKLDTVTVTDKNGNKIELTDKGNGEYTFKMPATKVNVETTFVEETTTEDNTMMNLFVDVPDDTYYYDAVLWAAKNGITGGMDDTHFAPDITCTRVQAITFLWRAAGSPMPKSSEISFEDVETDSYYYYAVLWALENGITSGTSATTFSPDDTCSRGQIVTFLWRSEKSPTVGMDNTFTDVSSDSYYADATNWAVANGITSGTSDTTFSPDENCTRGQIVTFLYRFFVK